MSAAHRGPTTLEELVAGHCRRFPWYRELVEAGLSELPLIDERVLAAHYYTAPVMPGAEVYLTSGTSGGARKQIQYCAQDDDNYVSQRRDLFSDFFGPAVLERRGIAVSDLGTGHAAALGRRVFSDLGLDARDIDFTAPVAEHVAVLNELQPDVLFTMPMILDQILLSGPALTARPGKIIVVGDLAPPAWRANVAERFGMGIVDVLDVMGSIEIGAIAYSDHVRGGYRFHDHITAEVLAADGTVRDSGDGELVLTSMTRDYFPAVRFVTGDLVAGLRQNGVSAVCDRFLGRVSGDVKHGERISGYDLCEAMAGVFPGCPFEVVEGTSLIIRVVADEVTSQQQDDVRAALRSVTPSVATMLDSGLVGSILVSAVTLDELRSGRGKRRFNLADV